MGIHLVRKKVIVVGGRRRVFRLFRMDNPGDGASDGDIFMLVAGKRRVSSAGTAAAAVAGMRAVWQEFDKVQL